MFNAQVKYIYQSNVFPWQLVLVVGKFVSGILALCTRQLSIHVLICRCDVCVWSHENYHFTSIYQLAGVICGSSEKGRKYLLKTFSLSLGSFGEFWFSPQVFRFPLLGTVSQLTIVTLSHHWGSHRLLLFVCFITTTPFIALSIVLRRLMPNVDYSE